MDLKDTGKFAKISLDGLSIRCKLLEVEGTDRNVIQELGKDSYLVFVGGLESLEQVLNILDIVESS